MSHFQKPLKITAISITLAGIAGFLLFTLLHALSEFKKNEYIFSEQQDAINYGESLKTAVDRELNSVLFISNGLASYFTIYKDQLDADNVNALLKDLWSRAKHVRNLSVAVGYRFKYVYPVNGNEKVLGVDLHSLPTQWSKVKMAVDSREGIIDGPIPLIQGGNGIVYRYPIFIKNEYWGIISTVINTQPFLDAAFQQNQKYEYVFAIRTEDKNVFYGNAKLFDDKRAVLIDSNLPNGKWEWAIEKRNLEQPTYFYIIDLFAVVLSLLTAIGIYYYIHERYSLTREAMMDSLTNLPNRRFLDRKLIQASIEAEKNNELICIMLIDLDYFKTINDTYGHAFGDEALVKVAEIIQSTIRGTDTLSRMGGDEFVLLLNHLKTANDAEAIASKIMESFNHPQSIMGSIVKLSLSIGLATSTIGEKVNIEFLLKHADEALYLAKGEGRGRYKVYQEY